MKQFSRGSDPLICHRVRAHLPRQVNPRLGEMAAEPHISSIRFLKDPHMYHRRACSEQIRSQGGRRFAHLLVASLFVTIPLLVTPRSLLAQTPSMPQEHGALGEHGMVATVQPLATQAGLEAFRRGGNAVDAAIAAALTLGVVDGHNSGIGGGCFILIRTAEGGLFAIDGRETAPAAATRDMYLRDGKAAGDLSKTGPLAVATPGAIAAYAAALLNHGKLKMADVILPAAELAEEGFAIDRVYARNLASVANILTQFPGSRDVLLKPDGSPWQEGERLVQSDLARTYRGIGEQGWEWFYRGPVAEAIGQWMEAEGGILTKEDFASYQVKYRQPIETSYRGYTLVGFPPPSSGGVHVAQILNILERFDLRTLAHRDPPRYVHLVGEAMKLAFADRAHWLGDGDFVDVPTGLISKNYADRLARRLDVNRAIQVEQHGLPPAWDSQFFGKHTTHIATADDEGNWVAITQTVNTTFGSKVIVPGTGIILNNEMDDFSIAPGVPNAFGLVGAEANAVAPGKRPLSSMSPTIVLKGNTPVMTLGAAGGPKIITQVVLGILNHLDLDMPIDQAIAQPRFHHQWFPDQLLMEASQPTLLIESMESFGHRVRTSSVAGLTQGISRHEATGWFHGAHDPRVPGQAAGFRRAESTAKPQ